LNHADGPPGPLAQEAIMGVKETNPTGPHGQQSHENPDERRRRLERSLEQGLEDTFPGSDAINIVQPPPSALDRRKKPKVA
jgi:hypothetical protein